MHNGKRVCKYVILYYWNSCRFFTNAMITIEHVVNVQRTGDTMLTAYHIVKRRLVESVLDKPAVSQKLNERDEW